MSEYDFTEDDLKSTGGGGKSIKPVGDYDIQIEGAETAKDTNGRPYLKFVGEIVSAQRKGGKVFENYLPFGRATKGKNEGKLDARTVSFLKATGQKSGTPIGAPGADSASKLNGTIVSVRLEHEYKDVPGEDWPVRTWQKEFKDIEASGRLQGIEAKESLGYYSVADDFAGIGGDDDDENEPVW